MNLSFEKLSAGWFAPPITGLLVALSFPDFDLFPLAWIALIPFLGFLLTRDSLFDFLTGHFLATGVFFLILFYWIPGVISRYGGLPAPVSFLVYFSMVALMGLLLLPASLGVWWLSQRGVRLLALILAPGLWTAAELLRNFWPMGGFPWGSLGYTQSHYHWLLQCADVAGVYGLTFLIVLVNAGLCAGFLMGRWRMAGLAGALFLVANVYGAWTAQPPAQGPELKAGLIQGDVRQYAEPDHYTEEYFVELPLQFDEAVSRGAQLVILPEAQNPFRLEENAAFRDFWTRKVERAGVSLLLNSSRRDDDRFYNSVYILQPSGEISYRYDKIKLVPFGEYVPLGGLLGLVGPLVAEVSGFTAGEKVILGTADGLPLATLICYEAIFPEIAREAVLAGARILVNISNDGWYGRTAAPAQHLQIAIFRAVETRVPLLRATNTGYSALITPAGRLRERTRLFVEDVKVLTVAPGTASSIWLWGGYPLLLTVVIATTFLLLLLEWKKAWQPGNLSG